jgi:hypothetical protein
MILRLLGEPMSREGFGVLAVVGGAARYCGGEMQVTIGVGLWFPRMAVHARWSSGQAAPDGDRRPGPGDDDDL